MARKRIGPRPAKQQEPATADEEPAPKRRRGGYRPWAELLRRTFAIDIGKPLSVQGLATVHYTKAAPSTPETAEQIPENGPVVNPADEVDFAVGVNTTLYAHKVFHLVDEVSFQGRKDGDAAMGTAVRFSVVPTIVPTGELTPGARAVAPSLFDPSAISLNL